MGADIDLGMRRANLGQTANDFFVKLAARREYEMVFRRRQVSQWLRPEDLGHVVHRFGENSRQRTIFGCFRVAAFRSG